MNRTSVSHLLPRLLAGTCLAATLFGCQNNRPPAQAPEQAIETYKARLAETCSGKHRDQLSPERFNEFAKDFYIDADTQTQQLIDLDASKLCATSNNRPDCYNTGFLQASQQIGNVEQVAKDVCSLKLEANPSGPSD